MKNRIFSLVTLPFLLLHTFLPPMMPVARAAGSNWGWVSTDLDGDGLPNSIETSGWCNAVGCFQTDPLDPDSDDDNLTDGEEKLFDANPTSDASPGIYVIYENSLKTKEYYPWQQYGHKLIARGDDFDPPNPDDLDVQYGHGTDLDAIVVRRGTTFYIGGPLGATLQYTKSEESSLDNLTITPQDPFNGQWQVTVPSASGGTVGKYTLTLAGKSLDLFVIFELPTPSGELTQLGIEKFVYDDNPNKSYDNKSILLGDYRYPPETGAPYSIPSGEFIAEGLAYNFTNQQYNRYLLEDYVIEAINGKTSQYSAASALTDKVDAVTIFSNPRVLFDSWKTINPPGGNPRNQCSNISGLLTSFNRAAGIPAHPVMVDWRISSFDHATEIWLNGSWWVYRGYKYLEMVQPPENPEDPDPQTPRYPGLCSGNHSLWPGCGNYQHSSRYNWGRYRYRPWHSGAHGSGNMIIQADENWTSAGQAYRWASWDIDRILLNPYRFMTQNAKYWGYWGWTEEPVDYGSSWSWPELPPDAPTGVAVEPGMEQATVSWDVVGGVTYNIYYRQGGSVDKRNGDQIAGVTSPHVVDSLTSGEEYAFAVVAEGPTGESPIDTVVTTVPLPSAPTNVSAVPGDGQVTVSWDEVSGATSYNLYYQEGTMVYTDTATKTVASSPHTVTPLTNGQEYAFAVTAVGSGGESALSEIVTATPEAAGGGGLTMSSTGGESSLGYASLGSEYHSSEVKFGEVVAEYGVDLNGNGQYDQLILETEVIVNQPGDYWLLGQLSAAQPDPRLFATGGVIAQALVHTHLEAGTQIVKLIFGGVEISLKRVDGPYVLSGLWITNVEDPGPTEFVNDSLAYRGYAYTTGFYQAPQFETHGAMFRDDYSHYPLDSDGDGQSEGLVVNTGIYIFQPDNYTVEGSLYDSQDEFVARANWTGTGTEVSLTFDKVIGHAGPYSLRDLELFNGQGQSIDYIYEAYSTELIPGLLGADTASFDIYPESEGLVALGETITPTQVFTESLVGGNLQVDAEVEVSEAGSYKLEAWLADSNGNLVTWASGQPTQLGVGVQTLSVTFNGSNIRAHGVDGPYQVVALKILDGNASYEVLDKVDVALTTQAYTIEQFAASDSLFEDYAEDGEGQWVVDPAWGITEGRHQYFGLSKAWYANDADASLTLATPLDFSEISRAVLKFQTSYNFGSGETGYVEVSTDGNNWESVATYTGNGSWSWSDEVQFVDLSDYAEEPTVWLRFRLDSDGGASDGWYVDDVIIAGSAGESIFLPIILKQ